LVEGIGEGGNRHFDCLLAYLWFVGAESKVGDGGSGKSVHYFISRSRGGDTAKNCMKWLHGLIYQWAVNFFFYIYYEWNEIVFIFLVAQFIFSFFYIYDK
jgi:hypothetical protein